MDNYSTSRADSFLFDTRETFPYTHGIEGKHVESCANNRWIALYNVSFLSRYFYNAYYHSFTAAAVLHNIFKYINKAVDFVWVKTYVVMVMKSRRTDQSVLFLLPKTSSGISTFSLRRRSVLLTLLGCTTKWPGCHHRIPRMPRIPTCSRPEYTSDLMLYFGRRPNDNCFTLVP